MKKYDVKCPICGTVNHDLYLEETNGWMECEHCHETSKTLGILPEKMKRVVVYTPQQAVVAFAQKA